MKGAHKRPGSLLTRTARAIFAPLAGAYRLFSLGLSYAFIGLIQFYRICLSPLKPPTCRFTPTCSAYAIEAIQKYGPFKGGYLALWRILRCQPFCKGGHDPVP